MAMLVVGSVASQGANVSAAEQMTTGRIVAAWPSFALIGAYELLMRSVRSRASSGRVRPQQCARAMKRQMPLIRTTAR